MSHAAIVEGAYLQDILDQPRALRDTLDGLTEWPAGFDVLERRLDQGGFSRVVLTGMGSSFHALHPLHLALVAAGQPSLMVDSSELLHYQRALLGEGTLLVVVSQSGRSVEVVRLLDAREGSSVIAVCNTAKSPLAEQADACVMTRAGEEASVSCKTYLAAQLALAWLARLLGGQDAELARAPLVSAPEDVESYLSAWRDHVAELVPRLEGIRSLFVVGRGPSLAAAGTAGLIIKEATRFHAEGMGSAAFRHGPLEIIDPSVFVLVLEGGERTRSLNRKLAADVMTAGGRSALVSAGAETAAFALPPAPGELRPILELLPAEMISLALGVLAGREAGRFQLAGKITTTE